MMAMSIVKKVGDTYPRCWLASMAAKRPANFTEIRPSVTALAALAAGETAMGIFWMQTVA
jgi:hypothetical protein